MTEIVCPGLDGTNPLHVLAALGVLRLLERNGDRPRMSWRKANGTWAPVYYVDLGIPEMADCCAKWLNGLGMTADTKDNNEGTDHENKSKKALKDATILFEQNKKSVVIEAREKELKGKDKKLFIDQRLAQARIEMDKAVDVMSEIRAQKACALGAGIAHIGDVIGVESIIFRELGADTLRKYLLGCTAENSPKQNDLVLILDQLPGLSVDPAINDERLTPSAFSFSNGQSGQCLLKNFRDNASACSMNMILSVLSGGSEESNFLKESCRKNGRKATHSSLNWDPSDRNDYAFVWSDPGERSNKRPVNVVTNSLAYIGLSFFPVCHHAGKSKTIGWENRDAWIWPIWVYPIGICVVKSLLASNVRGAFNPQVGVEQVYRASLVAVGSPPSTRYYFAPARPI